MAESLKFLKGMFKDSGRLDQPENTYRDALNLIIDEKKNLVANEYGTEYIGNLVYTYYEFGDPVDVQLSPIGTIKLDDNSLIVFATNTLPRNIATAVGVPSEIVDMVYSAIFKVVPNSKTVTLLYITISPLIPQPLAARGFPNEHLNFDTNHPITGEFRLSPSGDILVYFTDNKYKITVDPSTQIEYVENYNPPRVFNVSRQERALAAGSDSDVLYGDTIKTPVLLNVFMETPVIPTLESIQVLEGGALEIGAYYLGLALADEDLTETNVVTVFNPVYIVPDSDASVPYEMISGAPIGTQTNKLISWRLSSTTKIIQYKYIVPYIIKYSGNSLLAYKLNPIETGNDVTIIYTGLERAQGASPSEVVLDKVKYLAAKSITQLDNKLYMANLVGRKDIGYQRFANNIKLNTIILEQPNFDVRHYDIVNLNYGYSKMIFPDQPAFSNNDRLTGTWPKFEWLTTREGLVDAYINQVIRPLQNGVGAVNGYRNPYFNTFYKGYRRGEIYAFYISFVLKDGSETYAYHIPGRPAFPGEDALFNGNLAVDDGYTIFKPQEISSIDSQAYVYQYIDTSLPIPPPPQTYPSLSDVSTFGGSGSLRMFIPPFPQQMELMGQNIVITNALGQTNTRLCTGVIPLSDNSPNTRLNFSTAFTFDFRAAAGGYITYYPSSDGSSDKSTAYWKNLNEYYPNTDDFDVWDVDSTGAGVVNPAGITLRGSNVRHHKMPSNHRADRSYILRDVDFSSPDTTPGGGLDVTRDSIDFRETVRILGIQLENIKIPKFILGQVQGYKVYYAKRTQQNKTILGQSGVHPATPYLAANLNNTRSKASSGPFYNIWLLEGHHKTGGVHTRNALWVPLQAQPNQPLRPGQYLAQPVLKFHDFNLLRTKTTITPATHIDIQYVVTMQNWTGGYKGARRVEPPGETSTVPTNPGGSRVTYYTSLRSGSGDDEYAWVHPDLGNTVNFNASTTSQYRDILGPQVLWGNVYIGAMYNKPGRVNIDIGIPSFSSEDPNPALEDGNSTGIIYNDPNYIITRKQEFLLNDFQTIFMLDPGSATYINGLSILKTTPGASYKGASYIYNAFGESGIVLGLTSGVPSLGGYKGNRWSYWGLLGYAWQIRNSGSNGATGDLRNFALELQHYPYFSADASITRIEGFKNILSALIPNSLAQQPRQLTVSSSLTAFPATQMVAPATTGRPNIYLVNLCAKKTDVFAPFDEQQLVWTGYYQEIKEVNLDTGTATPDINFSYYSGQSSLNIFGGDTYICKYSYRTTSATFGLAHFAKGLNSTTITGNNNDFIYGDIPFSDIGTTTIGANTFNVLNFGNAADTANTIEISASETTLGDVATNNWSVGSVDPFTTVYQFMIESDDNINYRHAGDPIRGASEASSVYFDKYVASEVLWRSPLFDLTKTDNILYQDHYSAVQDLRVTIPFPKRDVSTSLFPNRVIRSLIQDGSFADPYRYFLAFDYKDFAVNKGEIVNIFNLNALLYIHTENSLFRTKGKQNLELSDATQAYIGSGDLFAQEPDEFVQSVEGYLGLQNKFGSLVTKDGYIFVARKARKIFMVGDKISDLTELGMNSWARENIPFTLETYGWNADKGDSDATTNLFGFIVTYDPLFKRTLITKRELIPTSDFEYYYRRGDLTYNPATNWFEIFRESLPKRADGTLLVENGWTISFSHTLSAWASRHSYTPKMYGYTSEYMYSFDSNSIYEHSDISNPGNFYGLTYNFEIDCIFTGEVRRTQQGVMSTKEASKLYSSFGYTADVFQKLNIVSQPIQQFDPGFTSYYVYNTTQISGEETIKYLSNIRKVDTEWTLNNFRDLASIAPNTNLNVGQVTVSGKLYRETFTTRDTQQMFISEGVINPDYMDYNKLWYDRKKFVDRFVGIRLIYNNSTRNLINLYGVTAASRVSAR
jgi:hypothetical protein